MTTLPANPNKLDRTQTRWMWAVSLFCLAILAAATYYVGWGPDPIGEDGSPIHPAYGHRLNDFRNFSLGLAGIIGIILVVWRGFSRDNQAKANVATALQQAEDASRAQLSERYTKAIEQLVKEDEYELVMDEQTGQIKKKHLIKDHQTTRLGAIYALEALAKDYYAHKDEGQYWAILDLLCEYLRKKSDKEGWVSELMNKNKHQSTRDVGLQDLVDVYKVISTNLSPSNTEVQAIMGLLGRLPNYRRPGNALHALAVPGLNLKDTVLQFFRLEGRYPHANWQGAWLLGMQADQVVFDGSQMSRTLMVHCTLTQARFSKVALEHGALFNCDLANSVFGKSNLRETNLQGANLQRAKLRMADLRGADLQNAELQGAGFQGVDLSTAKGLTQAQIDQAELDKRTKLPPGLVWKQKTEGEG